MLETRLAVAGTQFSITFTSILRRFFLSYFIEFRILMIVRGGVSCSHFLLLYVYGGYDYLVNLKVVSKTTKCGDNVIFLFFKNAP